jgi:hypothetical protein
MDGWAARRNGTDGQAKGQVGQARWLDGQMQGWEKQPGKTAGRTYSRGKMRKTAWHAPVEANQAEQQSIKEGDHGDHNDPHVDVVDDPTAQDRQDGSAGGMRPGSAIHP